MAVHSRVILTGSTNGKPFRLMGATTSGGTIIHTSGSATGANNGDEVWLWMTNTETTTCQVTLSFGGTATGERMLYSVPAQSGYLMVSPGLFLNGGLIVRGYASASNQISVVGYVNRTATA